MRVAASITVIERFFARRKCRIVELNSTVDSRLDDKHPFDCDLSQMTDDGCPLTPDPTRWSDVEYRDNTVESPAETDGALLIATSGIGTNQQPSSHCDRLIARNLGRARWRAVCEQLSRKRN